MTNIPYPFQHDRGPYYHVALGDGEYIRVVLAGDYRIERKALNRWIEIALRQHQQNCGHAHVEECRAELDELYLALEASGYGE